MKRLSLVVVFLLVLSARPSAQLPHGIPACPASSENVPAGQTHVYAGTLFRNCVSVSGTLRLDHGLRLTIGTLQVLPGGRLETVPNISDAIVTFDGSTPMDAEQWMNGLVIMGQYDLRGESTATKVRMTAELPAGAFVVQLANTTGMRLGGQLVLGESRYIPDGETGEQPQIVTINGLTSTSASFSPANSVLRRAARNSDHSVHTYPYVGYVSRGLTFRSANPAGVRAHSVITGNATGTIEGVAFVDMGRTRNDLTDAGSQQFGRYAMHYHHNHLPSTFRNNAIVRALKWGMSVHRSPDKLVQNTVVAGAQGWCLGTEDGIDETNITFDGNLLVGCDGDGNRGDRGIGEWTTNPLMIGTAGVGVWIASGSEVNVTNNHVMGARVAAYKAWGNREDGGMDLGTWSGNSCWSGKGCVELWYIAGGVIENHLVANGWFGTHNYPTWRMTYSNWTIRGDPDQIPPFGYASTGFDFGDYTTTETTVSGANIQNMFIGIRPAWAIAGFTGNGDESQPRTFRILNSAFCGNTRDVWYFVFAGSAPTQPKPLHTTLLQNSSHCAASPIWAAATGEMRQNSGDAVPIFEVVNFNGVSGDNFRVHSNENAPGGSTTRPRVLDRVTGGGTPPPPPPPPVDTDGDGGTDDIDQCDTQPGPASNGYCPVAPPPPPPGSFTLEYNGIVRDLAAPGFAVTTDGTLDPQFLVTFSASTVVSNFHVSTSVGGEWDSNGNGWAPGVSATANGPAIGQSASSQTFYVHVAEGGVPRFPNGGVATVTATVNGVDIVRTVTIGGTPPPPPPPPPGPLVYSGITRDMIAPGFAVVQDGTPDPEFIWTFSSATAVTHFHVSTTAGGEWDTDGAGWAIAVSTSASSPAVNPNGPVNHASNVFYLYVPEQGVNRFPSGAVVTVTATVNGVDIVRTITIN